jgi:NADH:ubiquinone oxidoreductase subunit
MFCLKAWLVDRRLMMRKRLSFSSWMANIQVNVFTWRAGVLVGTDEAGNRYYREKKPRPNRRERRWALYAGEPEATLVPPEWHGWLHHSMDTPLPANSSFHKPWIKAHQPNATGTLAAYRPPGHLFQGGQRDKATGDYEAWTPE